MTATLVKGGLVLDASRGDDAPLAADVLIDGTRIAAVLPRGEVRGDMAAVDVLDATDKLVVPGFFNAHYHSHDIFLKGCFEPTPLELWVLDALPRSYPPRSLEEIRLRTLLGAVECVRAGITTIQDMVTLFPLDRERVDAVVAAYEEAGVRVVLGLQVADVPPLDTTPYWRETIPPDMRDLLNGHPLDPALRRDPLDVIEESYLAHHAPGKRVRWAIAPSSPERCSPPLLERLRTLSERYALPVYSHVYISKSEALNARQRFATRGGSLIEFLDHCGLLNERLSLAHGVWLDDREVRRLADAKVSVVLNPISNLKAKNGVAPIRPLYEAGVNLALGCDNGSCTDAQNMFQAMKMYCLLAAVSDPRPGPPAAGDALRAATVNGARTAGLAGELGAVAPGMRADLVLLDLADPAFVPLNHAARQLVYSECGRAVETVIVDGRVVMEKRQIKTIREPRLRDAVNEAMERFRSDAEAVMAKTSRLRPFLLEADRRTWAHDLGFGRYIGRQ
ncbi:MAG: amidohydrolase family protein [Burkholderiales bacterium]|nr:amidohydrolase family protein [Burkholderiales bacterium]